MKFTQLIALMTLTFCLLVCSQVVQRPTVSCYRCLKESKCAEENIPTVTCDDYSCIIHTDRNKSKVLRKDCNSHSWPDGVCGLILNVDACLVVCDKSLCNDMRLNESLNAVESTHKSSDEIIDESTDANIGATNGANSGSTSSKVANFLLILLMFNILSIIRY